MKKQKHPLDKWKKTKAPKTAKVVAGDKEGKDLTLAKHKKYSGVGGRDTSIKMDIA